MKKIILFILGIVIFLLFLPSFQLVWAHGTCLDGTSGYCISGVGPCTPSYPNAHGDCNPDPSIYDQHCCPSYCSDSTIRTTEGCPSDDYPYCRPGINWGDCDSVVLDCWMGDATQSLTGDCTYNYDPGGATVMPTSPPGVTTPSHPDPAIQGNCASGEINTAIGCISFGSMTSLSRFVLGWSIGIAGGIAFILSVAAGFMISTSAGNPKRLQAGQELLNSALAGLLFLIFSVFILRLIGVDILGIPGL